MRIFVGSWLSALRLVRDLVVTVPVLAAALPLWWLPRPAATALGRWYGRVGFFLWPVGRRAGMINLRRAYGSAITRAGARRAIWQVFGSLGQAVAEGIQFARRFKRGEPGWEGIYEPEDPALEARLLADLRPKIFVTAHLGSWETAMMLVGRRAGGRGAVIVRRVDNPFLNAVVRSVRLSHESQWIDKAGACAEALRRLRQGEGIALLADENGGRRGVFVEFFGRPASTSRTPALLALITGSPIVVGVAVRRRNRSKLLMRLADIDPERFPGDPSAAVLAMTQEIARTLERWIRDDPDQWRWVHWRWKHRPDGSLETYGRRCLEDAFAVQSADLIAGASDAT